MTMLLDDLLSDERVLRRLIGRLGRHTRRPVDAPLHESFLDQAALHEELFTRFLAGAKPAALKKGGQYVRD
jgi:hypothetical protein